MNPQARPAQPASGGEREGDRRAMEGVQADLVRSGVPSREAERVARESAIRTDRRLREEGRR